MKFSPSTFLTFIKQIVMGDTEVDGGFLKKDEGLTLLSLRPDPTSASLTDNSGGVAANPIVAIPAFAASVGWDGATKFPSAADEALITDIVLKAKAAIAALAASVNTLHANMNKITSDEANARVILTEEAVDTIGVLMYHVPRDYDEAVDELTFRVLASQLTQAVDTDVQLDANVYVKQAGVALSADKNPTKPATILSTTEQWLEFDLSGYGLERDDVVIVKLITDGHNDTDGEEVLVHAVEMAYRSTLVSYNEEDSSGNGLR